MIKDNRTGVTGQAFDIGVVTLDSSAQTVASTLVLPGGGGTLARLSDLSSTNLPFSNSINFPNTYIQSMTAQGTPSWTGTLTTLKATVATVSTQPIVFIAYKNNASIGTITIAAGTKIATTTVSIAATTTDFFGAAITSSSGDATGAVFTFIFTKS